MSRFGFDIAEVKLSLVTPQTLHSSPEIADTLLDYALRYADLGWYVIPVRQDKKPVDGYGLNSATKDPAVIRNIWTQHPSAGIAIACDKSGLVVLDIDPRNGGRETLARLEAEHGVIYSAIASVTQSGGEHRVFKAESGVSYPGTLGAGLDVKHRGYILVEPSQGESGNYRWQGGKNPLQGALPIDSPAIIRSRAETPHGSGAKIRPGSVIEPEQVYKDLARALKHIPPEISYDEGWLKILQGISRLSDKEKAYAIAREWSLRSTKDNHTAAAFDSKWRSLMREDAEVGHRTVFYIADTYSKGWREDEPDEAPASTLPEVYSIADFDLNNLPPHQVHST